MTGARPDCQSCACTTAGRPIATRGMLKRASPRNAKAPRVVGVAGDVEIERVAVEMVGQSISSARARPREDAEEAGVGAVYPRR